MAAAKHNQALSALMFLYREVLGVEVPLLDGVQRPRTPKRITLISDEATQQIFAHFAEHVTAGAAAMKAGAMVEFLGGVDPCLLAKAMTLRPDAVVVTHAQRNHHIRRKFSIHNVGQSFGISCIDPLALLSRTDARFVLAESRE